MRIMIPYVILFLVIGISRAMGQESYASQRTTFSARMVVSVLCFLFAEVTAPSPKGEGF